MNGICSILRTGAAAVILTAVGPGGAGARCAAAELAPSERIFPATTRAWVSAPDMTGLQDRFDRSPYGRLLADPAMEPFVKHVRAEIRSSGKRRLAKLELTLEDFEGIPGGEVAVAAIEAQPGLLATVLFVDTTGHEAEARELVATIAGRLVAKKAKPVAIAGAPAELSVFELPPEQTDGIQAAPPRPRRVAFALGGSCLFVGDDAQQVGQAFAVVTTGRQDSLAATPAFAGVMARCEKEAAAGTAPLRWFVDPLPFAKAHRATNPPREKRKGPDYLEIFGRQGFDAIRGAGGVIVFEAGNQAARLATMVWAPPLPGREANAVDAHDLAARMLRFLNTEPGAPPEWVPRDVAGWSHLNWDLAVAFTSVETLLDDIMGEPGVFDDVLASLKEDPEGPQVDVEADLVGGLGKRVVLINDHVDPADPDAERMVIAIEVDDEPKVAATIARVMAADKDMERKEIGGFTIWELIDRKTEIPQLQVETPGLRIRGDRDDDGRRRRQRAREKEEKLLPHAAVAVARGHLFIASHRDILERVLLNPGGDDAIARAEDHALAVAEIARALPSAEIAFRSFGREEKTLEPVVELLRRGSMPKSRSLFGQLLNALLGDGKPGSVREQRIDGSTLPEFERIRPYLGTAAVAMETVPDGWFILGVSLGRPQPDQEVARSPSTTAIER